jgi:hypothetical protein
MSEHRRLSVNETARWRATCLLAIAWFGHDYASKRSTSTRSFFPGVGLSSGAGTLMVGDRARPDTPAQPEADNHRSVQAGEPTEGDSRLSGQCDPTDARRYRAGMKIRWHAVVALAFFGTFLAAGPANAAPTTDSVACQRSDKLWNSNVIVNLSVANMAKHHCETSSQADQNAGLRPKKEWAKQRTDAQLLCDYVGSRFAERGSNYERIEAECIASWVEYVLYVEAHPQCLDSVNAAENEWIKNQSNMLNRLDVSKICPDPNFGADEPDPKGEADRKTSNFILGAFGIVGWLCIGLVAFGIYIAFVSGKGYQRS